MYARLEYLERSLSVLYILYIQYVQYLRTVRYGKHICAEFISSLVFIQFFFFLE